MAAAGMGAPEDKSKSFFSHPPGKKCRVCTDFKSWMKTTKKETEVSHQCPADREELGQSTWTYLHTMAAYCPEQPSKQQSDELKKFVTLFSQFYPCEDCAEHMQSRLQTHPPLVQSREEFARWMCEMHNEVNQRLGKKLFDCSKVDERWRDGWKDGTCD